METGSDTASLRSSRSGGAGKPMPSIPAVKMKEKESMFFCWTSDLMIFYIFMRCSCKILELGYWNTVGKLIPLFLPENQEHCRWEFFDWMKFWRLLFLLSFWHRQEREVFVAHELHLCILYTFFEANMLLTGSDGVFFHTSWDCILLLVLRVLRAFTGLFLGSDKSHKLIRPEWSLKQFAGCYTSVVKQVGNDCCNKPQP